MSTELWQKGAAELARMIREKEVSSWEVVQAHLDRITAVNDQLNAVTVVLAERALAMADTADEAIAVDGKIGPLHGVPVTVKENIDLAGSATTEGVVAFAEAVPPIDAPQMAQIARAGAIPIGRTNMPDFGLRWHTDNALRGATINPWDSTRTPGGSSAGEAVALATGMSPLGLGNDYGGSLRWPTVCNGVTAIRPTMGRVATASAIAPAEPMMTAQLFGVQGPMARHVSDVRLALSLMSGLNPRDPWWTPAPLTGPTVDGPLKVAVTKDPGGLGVDTAVSASIDKAAQVLADVGYIVEEIEPPLVVEAHNMWANLAVTEINTLILPLVQPILSADALTFLQLATELYPPLDLAGYAFTLADRNRIAREWSLFLTEYPIVLGPVSTNLPFAVGADLEKESLVEFMNSLRLTTAMNLIGFPAAVVPVGVADGLPLGVQIIGARYREDMCLDAAEAIEQALGLITPIDPV